MGLLADLRPQDRSQKCSVYIYIYIYILSVDMSLLEKVHLSGTGISKAVKGHERLLGRCWGSWFKEECDGENKCRGGL